MRQIESYEANEFAPNRFSPSLHAAGGTAAAQNNLPPDVQAMAKKVMMPLVLKVPGLDGQGQGHPKFEGH